MFTLVSSKYNASQKILRCIGIVFFGNGTTRNVLCRTPGQACTVRAYLGSQAFCTYEYAARRVQHVLYAQVKRCGCRRWCCGLSNTAFALHGVDFTQRIGRLRNKCVPQRTNALMSVFSGMKLMCTCAKKAS
eukprot:366455-Chlamydomonas_euryale.AAC.3